MKILGFILILIIGITIGNVAQTNLINGIVFFFAGIFFYLFTEHIYKKAGLFPRIYLINLFSLVCLEAIGFIIGFVGLINLNTIMIDIAIIIFLVLLILIVFVKELIELFPKFKKRK